MDNKYYYAKLTRIVVVVSSILFIIAMVLFIVIKSVDNSTNTGAPINPNNNGSSSTTPDSNNTNPSKEGDAIKKPAEITETVVKEDISFNGSLRISEKETTSEWAAMTIVATSIETDPALLIYKIHTDGSRELVVGPTTTVARKKLASMGVPNSIIDSPVVAKYAHGGDE